jgi:adenylate cyclase
MKPVTHYEVYQVKFDRWVLRARMAGAALERAVEIGRERESETGLPVQVVEERFDPETGKTELKVLRRLGKTVTEVKGPPEDADLAARIFMVILNGLGIGAIVVAVAAVLTAPMREAAGSTYTMFLLFLFAATTLASALVLFKLYVPIELVLWRAKSKESRERTSKLLLGFETEAAPPPMPARRPVMRDENHGSSFEGQTHARPDEQTAFQFASTAPPLPPELDGAPAAPTGEQAPAPVDGAPPTEAAATPAPPPVAELAPEAAEACDQLFVFADSALAMLALARPQASAFERFGFNLYLAGGATGALAVLAPEIKRDILCRALERAGTSAASAQGFADRLEPSIARPRFRMLYDAGIDAFMAPRDESGAFRHDRLTSLMHEWSDPTARGARAETVTFLLTDLVGSTAMTAQIGNSGAQRVVRAHNTIVRQVVKDYRGKEVKHTGDGLLLTFSDPATAARAAMEIQSEAAVYAEANPEAPLSLRVGLHTGEAGSEDGDYFGEAVMLLDGICAAADAGEISCSEEIVDRARGPAFSFTDVGPKPLKGTELERTIFKLAWKPKPKAAGARVEYRQIGALSTDGVLAPEPSSGN